MSPAVLLFLESWLIQSKEGSTQHQVQPYLGLAHSAIEPKPEPNRGTDSEMEEVHESRRKAVEHKLIVQRSSDLKTGSPSYSDECSC